MSGFVITTRRKIIEVDPNEVIDYIIDLSSWVRPGDLISLVTVSNSSTADFFSVSKNSAPLTIPEYGDVAADKAVVFWVQGGTVGTSGRVTFNITTSGGRKIDVVYEVIVKNR